MTPHSLGRWSIIGLFAADRFRKQKKDVIGEQEEQVTYCTLIHIFFKRAKWGGKM